MSAQQPSQGQPSKNPEHLRQDGIDAYWNGMGKARQEHLAAMQAQSIDEAIDSITAERDNMALRLAWLFGMVLSSATFAVLLVLWAVGSGWHSTVALIISAVVALIFSTISPSSAKRLIDKERRSRRP